jgi:hypothetical protein
VRADGIQIEYSIPPDQRTFVEHYAVDVWAPLLTIGAGILSGAGGNLLSGLIARLSKGERNTTVHIRWKVKAKNGSLHTFEFDGAAKSAEKAAKSFERSLDVTDDRKD